MSLVFYDTETTGTNSCFDQILQFAAIKTDNDLNELDRFEIRSRLRPHIVPSPGAMHVTRTTAAQLCDPSLPSHYEMVREINAKMLSWSPAIFVGYNSIAFDEHLFRHALYQTLHAPYLTNTNGNVRSDILRVVQASSLFVPESFAIPIGEDAEPTYALDRLAPANGINHDQAHDAMADVATTVALCRLVADRAPDIWSAFMRFSKKAAVVDFIESEPVFCLSDFYFGRPYSWLVTAIGVNAANSSEHYVYNLAIDLDYLASLTFDDLVTRASYSPKPVRRLRTNAAPMLMPADEAPAICSALTVDRDEIDRRAARLAEEADLRTRLISAFEATIQEYEPSPHVEEQLYGGKFFERSDEALMAQFHASAWENRPSIVESFADPRLRALGRRLIYEERPHLLQTNLRDEYEQAIARRITDQTGTVPWLTVPAALQEIDELTSGLEPDEVAHLEQHRAYLMQRLDDATSTLALRTTAASSQS